ncbi:MAG: ABC transporter permease [Planctomycetes bacterium]|nr:ABC transporter permease [Planctomycetota bacterium]
MHAWFRATGATVLAGVELVGGVTVLFGRTVAGLFQKWPRRGVISEQMHQIGNKSLPVVLTTGAFTGMVLAAQTYFQFRRLAGMEAQTGAVVGVSLVKELGPVLTALMLAGRVGAAITAELGTMRVTEQIDALETLGTDPVRYLVVPRFLACFLLLPLLTVMADAIGMLGGYLVAVKVYGVDAHYYIEHTRYNVTAYAVMTGVIKSFVFGAIIAMVACHKGFHSKGGAEGVGRATCESVVAACITVLISNFFLTLAIEGIHNALVT